MNRNTKFVTRVILIAIFLAVIGGYGYYQARKIIRGPQIVIHSPSDGTTVEDQLVEISGKAANIKDISLNDRPIYIDEKGNFSEKLLVPQGYTIITLKASDKFGHSTQKVLHLHYAGQTQVLPVETGSVSPVSTSSATSSSSR